MSTVSFLTQPQFAKNSLLIECFPLTYDLNGFNSEIKKHLLSVGPLEILCMLYPCALLFLALHGVKPN